MDSGFHMLGQFQGGQAFQIQQGAPVRMGPANIQGAGTNKLKIGLHPVHWNNEINDEEDMKEIF